MDYVALCYLSISEASRLIRNKEMSPVELVSAHLSRIEQTDHMLNSFVTLLGEEAQEAAKQAEKAIHLGNYLGPLHGIPIGLKDLYYTKGIPTKIGARIFGSLVPSYDAAVTERFKDAGAILMGKLQMHEFALGASSENPHHGPAHNPWNTDCITGGSSGGSGSAVASGQCMGALGSDTGGSIRIPASFCGIVGLKPTFGRVSRYGVYPLSSNLDTVGPMTRTVRDCSLVLNTIAGYDPRDPSSAKRHPEDFTATLGHDINGIRIGIPQEYFYDVIDSEVKSAVLEATKVLEGLGATIQQVSLPILNHSLTLSTTILLAEAAEIHLNHLRENANDIGDDVRSRLEFGALIPAIDYIKAQQGRSVFNKQVAQVMKTCDLLIAPTEPFGAPRIGEETVLINDNIEMVRSLLTRMTRPFNLTGTPTASVPCGFTALGMPIGMQIAGRAFDESTVLRVAEDYEQATEWHTMRPNL